ncbi:MAG TPA: DUF2911 domain-containing protein [Flavobacteriaceae bacterium]|nr:DUF2911 domain-containing protein [Flavobacteriaceae bacterium]
MKKTIVLPILLFLFVPFSHSQVKVPQASPHASLEQVVGLTKIEVDYSRPGVKDRKIFGELVPYGELWRTGANQNTLIEFSDDVVINGKTLKQGIYSVFTKPGKEFWQIYFYSDIQNWGLPQKWTDEKVVLETQAKVQELANQVETFTIMLSDLTNNSASLDFIWENTKASLKFEVPTEEKAMQSIKSTLSGEAKWSDYYAAADYFFSEGKDLKQAYEWITTAIKMNEKAPFYVIRKKALIEYQLGMREEAIESAKQSLEAAQEAKNEDYVKMNEASLKEWGAK